MSKSVKVTGVDSVSRALDVLMDLSGDLADNANLFTEIMRETATRKLADGNHVRTGKLRASVKNAPDEVERGDGRVSIGIRAEALTEPDSKGKVHNYAVFIEYGTGPLGDGDIPHTSKTSWVYYKPKEDAYFVGKPIPPVRFMRSALYDNRRKFEKIITNRVQEIWGSE